MFDALSAFCSYLGVSQYCLLEQGYLSSKVTATRYNDFEQLMNGIYGYSNTAFILLLFVIVISPFLLYFLVSLSVTYIV
jgi:hypothetical protein